MKRIGLITRFDSEIVELQREQIEYCEEINRFLRTFIVKKGKIVVRDQQVIYYYQDWRMYCSFTVDAGEDIEEYELQIHPLFWNALPKGVEKIKLRFRGRNLVSVLKQLDDEELDKAVSFFVYNLTEDEKEILRKELSEIGLPSEYTMDDDDLDAIIGHIMDRAVHVR